MSYVKRVLCRGMPRLFIPSLFYWDAGDAENDAEYHFASFIKYEQERGLRAWATEARHLDRLTQYLDDHLPEEVIHGSDHLFNGEGADGVEVATKDLAIVIGVLAYSIRFNHTLAVSLARRVRARHARIAYQVATGELKRVPMEGLLQAIELLEDGGLNLPIDEMDYCSPDY